MTDKLTIHHCECATCRQAEDHPDKVLHRQMNLLVSRLDEQQRRWYLALEATKMGHGGVRLMAQISGVHPDTIRRGQRELRQELVERPVDRVRLAGGGRPPLEKKHRLSNR